MSVSRFLLFAVAVLVQRVVNLHIFILRLVVNGGALSLR